MSWDSFIDPIAEFLGQDAESQVQQNNYRETLDGKYKPGFGDQFWGRANDGQTALDTKKNKEVRDKYKPILEAYDLQWRENMTAGTAERLIKEAKRKEGTKNTIEQATTAYYLPGAVEERLRAAEQRLDLLKSQEDNLAFQRRQAQRADDRYYDRLDREDARDSREGYQSLASGISALMAAFAIL